MTRRSPVLRPRSSTAWLRHFEESTARIEAVPWGLGPWLDQAERDAVAGSIQEFQLGESSEGRRFRAVAAEHAGRTGDLAYPATIDRFIGEEQQHARYLAQFLELEAIPLVRHTSVDGIFRRLRRLAGLETMLSVLITAEIIAQVYYAALGRATCSPVLRSICRRILVDEAVHVRFQAERIALLRRRSWLGRRVGPIMHGCLAAGACIVVWAGHR
ncbi:MAG: ferritin-like domain-containing protein, partial [Gemmatimonadota bacterium]